MSRLPRSTPSGNDNGLQPGQRRLDEPAHDPETAWAGAERLINTKLPPQYDAAVTLLRDLQELAQREDQAGAFARRFTALRGCTSAGPASSPGSTEPGSRFDPYPLKTDSCSGTHLRLARAPGGRSRRLLRFLRRFRRISDLPG